MDVVVQLGDVVFEGFEIPASIAFGGRHRAVNHQLPGGVRDVHMLGREDDALEWQGTFLGTQAVNRARALDAMRIAGRELTLSWHEFIYTVAIERFQATFEAPYRVPYSIGCLVVEDLTARVARAPANSFDTAIRRDVTGARAQVLLIGDGPLSGLQETLSSIARGINDFQAAAYATIAPMLAVASDIRARVQVLQDTAGAALNGAAAIASMIPGRAGTTLARRLHEAADGAMRAPALRRLDWQMIRLTTNLNAANHGASAVARTVSGAQSLFDIATLELGDARRWEEIARLSGRSDPRLTGITQIRVPPQ